MAFVFPDIYDIGISNLGMQILYDLVNQRPDALAERAYAPWVDMEDLMRSRDIPLYSLETKHPLAAFDILGFSLPYETLYTNTLNMLDLAGIPLRSSDRTSADPLIIAGGHACFNPEPMHAFIDAFVIGEGEEVIREIIDVVKKVKGQNSRAGNLETCQLFERETLLKELAQIPGCLRAPLLRCEIPRGWHYCRHHTHNPRSSPGCDQAHAAQTSSANHPLPGPEH